MTLNWHWNCSGVAPPALHVDSTTICVGCNITLVIRVGSPGDSGDVTQVTGSGSSATAGNGSTTGQTVSQAVPPPPAPPAPVQVVPPTPPAPPSLPLVPAPVSFPGAGLQPSGSAPAAEAALAVAPFVVAGAADHPSPRRTPMLRHLEPRVHALSWLEISGVSPIVSGASLIVRTVVIVRAPAARDPRARSPRRAASPLPPPPPPPERAPSFFGAATEVGAHGGSGPTGAVATSAAGFAFFGLFVSVSLLAPLVRGTFARARPHPPG